MGANRTLRDIVYEYANQRGGGLPLTAEEVCNAVVLWVQQYYDTNFTEDVKDNIAETILTVLTAQEPIELTRRPETNSIVISVDLNNLASRVIENLEASDLIDLFEGSETVVVDLNETGDKIEIHLDSELIAKIERALLMPTSTSGLDEFNVPVLSRTLDLQYKSLGAFGGKMTYTTHNVGEQVVLEPDCLYLVLGQGVTIQALSGGGSVGSFGVMTILTPRYPTNIESPFPVTGFGYTGSSTNPIVVIQNEGSVFSYITSNLARFYITKVKTGVQ